MKPAMSTLSNQIKMTDAMERELSTREHDALESLTFNERVEFVYVAVVVTVFCAGLLIVSTIFH
jgi:hypothetical protein